LLLSPYPLLAAKNTRLTPPPPGTHTNPQPHPSTTAETEMAAVRFLDPQKMVVLITGATAGFGRAAAQRFAAAGAKVIHPHACICVGGK
jgi:hypothetical protein